jgi:carbamoylphosphate synthase small subunit
MAAVLGIHAGDLKVVQAYEGSVIVVFQVFDPNDDITVLEAIKETFETVIPTIGMALGAPVMSFNNGESTTTMPGYEDLIEQEEDNLIENWFID